MDAVIPSGVSRFDSSDDPETPCMLSVTVFLGWIIMRPSSPASSVAVPSHEWNLGAPPRSRQPDLMAKRAPVLRDQAAKERTDLKVFYVHLFLWKINHDLCYNVHI